MARLVAQWDFEASDDNELAFKEGDIITLLEECNEDWWKGQLNSRIGLFPANRVELETPNEDHVDEMASNSYGSPPRAILPQDSNGSEFNSGDREQQYTASVRKNDLYSTTITKTFPAESQPRLPSEANTHTTDTNEESECRSVSQSQLDITQLAMDQLQREWIRLSGSVQMKMAAEKEDGGKISSWKSYYAVLCKGFLLLYKDSKKPSKSLTPIGSFDLDSCDIKPAGEQDTTRKHVFLITLPQHVTLYVETKDKKDFSRWFMAISKDLHARKETPDDNSEIMRLLRAVTADFRQMKVNKKLSDKQCTYNKEKDHKVRGSDGLPRKSKSRGFHFHKLSGGKNKDPPHTQTVAHHTVRHAVGDRAVFGGDLYLEDDGTSPRIVRLCVEEIEKRGLGSVGIYRLSGNVADIQKYRHAFNRNEDISFENQDINVVAGLLKAYFRELREPLLTCEYYEGLIDTARMEDYDERMYQIKSYIHALPEPNRIVLEYVARHLHLVSEHSDTNKMETSNLALLFSVGLLRSEQGELSSIMYTDLTSKVIEAIIQQVDWFFEVEDDYEDDYDEVHEGHPPSSSELPS